MEDYQKRVVEEKKELDVKIDKLSDFLNRTAGLPQAEVARMDRQVIYMGLYSEVLAERIENFA